ncbi:MAG: hypothetical protein MZW92_31460 [Comamonadaceae bacterium]|nr:hypothetical protein [Comamonadaceae bacterium]
MTRGEETAEYKTFKRLFQGSLAKENLELDKARLRDETDLRKQAIALKIMNIPIETTVKQSLQNVVTAAVGTDEQKQQANLNLLDAQIKEQERLHEIYKGMKDTQREAFATQQKILELEVQRLLMTKESLDAQKAQQAGRDFAKQIIAESVSGNIDSGYNKRLGDTALGTYRKGIEERMFRIVGGILQQRRA